MNDILCTAKRAAVLGLVCAHFVIIGGSAQAQDRWRWLQPARPVQVARPRPVYAQNSRAPLGTFRPTPFIMVGGDYPTGSVGYSPLESYGDTALALTGPTSTFRAATAPVLTYTRGYDGQTRVVEANSFSYPILPTMSPVVYPTEGNYYWGPRTPRASRWGSSAINWIDQN